MTQTLFFIGSQANIFFGGPSIRTGYGQQRFVRNCTHMTFHRWGEAKQRHYGRPSCPGCRPTSWVSIGKDPSATYSLVYQAQSWVKSEISFGEVGTWKPVLYFCSANVGFLRNWLSCTCFSQEILWQPHFSVNSDSRANTFMTKEVVCCAHKPVRTNSTTRWPNVNRILTTSH